MAYLVHSGRTVHWMSYSGECRVRCSLPSRSIAVARPPVWNEGTRFHLAASKHAVPGHALDQAGLIFRIPAFHLQIDVETDAIFVYLVESGGVAHFS